MARLFSGKEIPQLARAEHFFSSRDDIEEWLKQSGIAYDRLKDRMVQNGADVYIERYGLNDEEAAKAKSIMGDNNFFQQTDWVIYPKK